MTLAKEDLAATGGFALEFHEKHLGVAVGSPAGSLFQDLSWAGVALDYHRTARYPTRLHRSDY